MQFWGDKFKIYELNHKLIPSKFIIEVDALDQHLINLSKVKNLLSAN